MLPAARFCKQRKSCCLRQFLGPLQDLSFGKIEAVLKKLGSGLVQTCGLCCLFELVQLYTALQSLEVALYTVGRFDKPTEFTGKNDKIG